MVTLKVDTFLTGEFSAAVVVVVVGVVVVSVLKMSLATVLEIISR